MQYQQKEEQQEEEQWQARPVEQAVQSLCMPQAVPSTATHEHAAVTAGGAVGVAEGSREREEAVAAAAGQEEEE